MTKTIHVLPADRGWAVKREGRKTGGVFRTQLEAVKSAREMVRSASSWQLVVHGRDGRIREHDTYGMPRVQDAPGGKSDRIEKAVGKVTRERLGADPNAPRG